MRFVPLVVLSLTFCVHIVRCQRRTDRQRSARQDNSAILRPFPAEESLNTGNGGVRGGDAGLAPDDGFDNPPRPRPKRPIPGLTDFGPNTGLDGDLGNGNVAPPDDGNGPINPSGGSPDCVCVPYYQCDNGKIVTDGAGIIDPRNLSPNANTNRNRARALPVNDDQEASFCGAFHVCCGEPESRGPVTKAPYIHKCGRRNPFGINRRILTPIEKTEAEFAEWPWMAAILKFENGVNLFQCGGVLIDQLHVLTVAHCVKKFTDQQYELIVRMGEWDTQNTKEFYPHEDYKVSQIISHPRFRDRSLWNDVAILRLERKVEFRPNIESVCLPSRVDNFVGQKCVTTGWGKSAYKGGSYSNILKEVHLAIVDSRSCQASLQKTRLGRRFRLHNSFICAGGQEGRDSCKGDGGGPLVCERADGSFALAGLVSWGIDCGQPNVPGVYVNVAQFADWISKQTGFPLSHYT